MRSEKEPPTLQSVSQSGVPSGAPERGATHGEIQQSWPSDLYVGRASALKVGMWLFLLSDAFSFAGLLLAYGVLRGGATIWWPANEPDLGINFTAALTFLLICSSVTMVFAVDAARAANRKRTLLFLSLTVLGGVAFLVGQFHEYFGIGGAGLVERGLSFGQSARATTFFLVTSFHGLHVLSGVIVLVVMLVNAARLPMNDARHDAIESAGLFWHFVDLVWILVFTFVYLWPATAGLS